MSTAAQLSETIGYTLGISINATKPKVRETSKTGNQIERKSKPKSSKPTTKQESKVSSLIRPANLKSKPIVPKILKFPTWNRLGIKYLSFLLRASLLNMFGFLQDDAMSSANQDIPKDNPEGEATQKGE